MTLETDDSGIGLADFADSGISLDLDDDVESDIFLGVDSGLTMDTPSDSGIALEALDSAGSGNLDQTMPMMPVADGDDMDETQLEMPLLSGDDDDFELSGTDIEIPVAAGNTAGDSGMIVFDDDEDVDDFAPTLVGAEDEFDLSDDEFGDDDEFGAFTAEDDLDVAPEFMGDDDELEVFDAADDDFDDAFTSGTSHVGIAPQQVMVSAPQAEWGVGTFIGVLFSTGIMALCGLIMFDLVRTMWSWEQPVAFNSTILEQVRGLFGS